MLRYLVILSLLLLCSAAASGATAVSDLSGDLRAAADLPTLVDAVIGSAWEEKMLVLQQLMGWGCLFDFTTNP